MKDCIAYLLGGFSGMFRATGFVKRARLMGKACPVAPPPSLLMLITKMANRYLLSATL